MDATEGFSGTETRGGSAYWMYRLWVAGTDTTAVELIISGILKAVSQFYKIYQQQEDSKSNVFAVSLVKCSVRTNLGMQSFTAYFSRIALYSCAGLLNY